MKKFTKICLILAAALGCLGLVFCITAYALGADFRNLSVWYDENTHRFYTEDMVEVDSEYEERFSGIDELELDIANVDMTILPGESDEFVVRASSVSRHFSCAQEGNTLKIKSKRKNVFGINLTDKGIVSSMVVEVPKGTIFKEFDVEAGVGSVVATDIRTQELDIECGVGSIEFSGTVDKKCSVECGVGEVTLSLAGGEEDFNYEVECGIGEILLGNQEFSGIGNERRINNGADKKMSLECGVGSISVSFAATDSMEQGSSGEKSRGSQRTATGEGETKSGSDGETDDTPGKASSEEIERKRNEYQSIIDEYEKKLDQLDDLE